MAGIVFNGEINVATIFSILAGLGGLWLRDRQHVRRQAEQHQENRAQIKGIKEDVDEQKGDIKSIRTTQEECRKLIGATREEVALLKGQLSRRNN